MKPGSSHEHKCCHKEKLRRGLWSPDEDERLLNHIAKHGVGHWSSIPSKAGLERCGKSCRLRWVNYLRPDLKKCSFSSEEQECIIKLHNLFGNRWSKIASHLSGRTDNEIKNFWNGYMKKSNSRAKLQDTTNNRNDSISTCYFGSSNPLHTIMSTPKTPQFLFCDPTCHHIGELHPIEEPTTKEGQDFSTNLQNISQQSPMQQISNILLQQHDYVDRMIEESILGSKEEDLEAYSHLDWAFLYATSQGQSTIPSIQMSCTGTPMSIVTLKEQLIEEESTRWNLMLEKNQSIEYQSIEYSTSSNKSSCNAQVSPICDATEGYGLNMHQTWWEDIIKDILEAPPLT